MIKFTPKNYMIYIRRRDFEIILFFTDPNKLNNIVFK